MLESALWALCSLLSCAYEMSYEKPSAGHTERGNCQSYLSASGVEIELMLMRVVNAESLSDCCVDQMEGQADPPSP